MRKLVLGSILFLLPLSTVYADGNYALDPTHTYPNFTINHLGFSTMHGRFGKTKGKFTMDRKANKGSVELIIEAASINTGFKKRDDHLRSPDFLNVAEFPEITYKSTSVKFDGETKATITGDLTIMGTTKAVILKIDHINCGTNPFNKKPTCGFNATGSIKRSEFGLNYGLPAIGDDLTLSIEAEGIKQ